MGKERGGPEGWTAPDPTSPAPAPAPAHAAPPRPSPAQALWYEVRDALAGFVPADIVEYGRVLVGLDGFESGEDTGESGERAAAKGAPTAGAAAAATGHGGVTLRFQDGQTVTAAVAVGADGNLSTERAALLGDGPPTYSGRAAWRAVTDVPPGWDCTWGLRAVTSEPEDGVMTR